MRHNPFHVNPDARDRWLRHMRVAVDDLQLPPLHEAALWDYLERAAFAMVNTFEETP
jgi:hemoglobin